MLEFAQRNIVNRVQNVDRVLVQQAIAQFVHGMKATEPFWYGIHMLDSSSSSLSNLFGITFSQLSVVLQVAGLAQYDAIRGIRVLDHKFKEFVALQDLGLELIELVKYRRKNSKENIDYLRFGKRQARRYDPKDQFAKDGSILPPPDVDSIVELQEAFWNEIKDVVSSYTPTESGEQQGQTGTRIKREKDDSSTKDDNQSKQEAEEAHRITRTQALLEPILQLCVNKDLLKQDAFWKSGINTKE